MKKLKNQYNEKSWFFWLFFMKVMGNTRLTALLERSPLSPEDRHNIAIIFNALNPEKQYHILDNWDTYIIEMVMVRKEIDQANRALLEEAVNILDTLKDAKNAGEAERKIAEFRRQKQVRAELDAVQKYHNANKFKLIKSIADIPANQSAIK